MRVCLGGTFEPLHAGHQELLRRAVQEAGPDGSLLIGVTTGGFPSGKHIQMSYNARVKAITAYLDTLHSSVTVTVVPLTDPYGPAVDLDLDAIVVSPETHPTADQINTRRKQKGKPPLRIIEVPFVLAQDGTPISSTRIRNGEITRDGRLLRHG